MAVRSENKLSQHIKHQSLVLVRQKLGGTDRLSLFVYAKLQEKSV